MIEYNENGTIINCPNNIEAMLEIYKPRKFMLEEHQRKFIKTIKLFYKKNKYLSAKQFKWLELYYSIYAGTGDIEPEPF